MVASGISDSPPEISSLKELTAPVSNISVSEDFCSGIESKSGTSKFSEEALRLSEGSLDKSSPLLKFAVAFKFCNKSSLGIKSSSERSNSVEVGSSIPISPCNKAEKAGSLKSS